MTFMMNVMNVKTNSPSQRGRMHEGCQRGSGGDNKELERPQKMTQTYLSRDPGGKKKRGRADCVS